jgi:hypothetical protein
MRIKKPRKASIDEVRITREGEIAIIENADPSISVVRLHYRAALRAALIYPYFIELLEPVQAAGEDYANTLCVAV